MDYHFTTTLKTDMPTAIEKVTQALAAQGFGILTEIDIAATLKKKIDVDFRPYRILGACSPAFAHKALLAEDKIGTMLPCNVVVQQLDDGLIEVSAVDPMASMTAIENPALGDIAKDVRGQLQSVIDSL
jgi:uncharacterized protein (DUF302 family)